MGSLAEYRKKRRFKETPEPAGKVARAGGNHFVVQKHAATRLHYDFRLEMDGVLKSWAVPKGPSLNPGDKRLAVQTEDHPLDYASFEGVIPEGHYGAGEVMLWDHGTYNVEGTLPGHAQLERGDLKFNLHGEKLRGSFVLVKLRASDRGKGREWLLIKHRDAAVDPNWAIEEHDGSVTTGRTLEDIAANRPGAPLKSARDPSGLEGARKAAMPAKITPTLATLADKPFSNPEWLFEIKWDGERTLAWIRDGAVELRSRTGRDITAEYPELAILPKHIAASRAILDGEIVVLDENGRADFERLQRRFSVAQPSAALLREAPVTYYVFDILYCDGYDLRAVPLIERKQFLKQTLEPCHMIRFSDDQMEKGKELFDLARDRGLEGIIGKQARSTYAGRRSPLWLKFKISQAIDAVVGGWTAPRGSREYFGALLLGLYKGHALQFIGGVGSGFDQKSQKQIYDQLQELQVDRSPFVEPPKTREKSWWVRPRLVARAKYNGWTAEKNLRQPSFLGLRDDLDPKECLLEEGTGTPAPQVKTASLAGETVLRREADIEKELFEGRRDNVIIEIDERRVRLSNLNKVYFPNDGYTKRDLLAYYYRTSEHILPFLKDRPLVLRRYPNGIAERPFFQKDAGEGIPDWMNTVTVSSDEGKKEIQYFTANDRAALLYLTNLGCIDHNPWSSRSDDLEHPDYIFFDLDPTEETEFAVAVSVAKVLHEKLRALRLHAFIKTSGGRGIHLFVPIERHYTFEQGRTFVAIVERLLGREYAEWMTQEIKVQKRPKGKIHLDADQNAFGQSLASVYSVRAFPKAPVSAPLAPEELRPSLRSEKLNIGTVIDRLKRHGNPWADFWKKRQRLEPAIELLGKQIESKKNI